MSTPILACTDRTSGPLVLLQGIEHGNRFITANTPGQDPTVMADGKVAYRVLGYADTVEEGQLALFGRSYSSDSARVPCRPFARFHTGMDEWVLVIDRALDGSDYSTVRRANGQTHFAANSLLLVTEPLRRAS